MIFRNVELGKQLDLLRQEMQKLNYDLIQLVKENHMLNMEIQTLGSEVDKLRNEISKYKDIKV
jgi:regulator of replication initiation timing